MKFFNKKFSKNSKGITLISLIITIVIMLILATVTIGAINGGLFEYAGKAKKEVAKTEEVEEIQEAVIMAKGNSKTGRLVQTDFQNQMNKIAGEGVATVYDGGNEFVVLFNTNRMYTVDSKGNVQDNVELYQEATHTFATQITNNSLGGTEETAYEINSIEDLVDLSYTVNGIVVASNGEISITGTKKDFSGLFVKLVKDLNFKLPLSYEDSTRTDYGDINGNGKVEGLLTELTTGKGWVPIGKFEGSSSFDGCFDGNNKKISSLYINNTINNMYAGLFGWLGSNNEIKDLDVLGNIYCNCLYAGGIAGLGKGNITNCSFNGTIENISEASASGTGGIVGCVANNTCRNCYCKGKVIGKCNSGNCGVGGIVGTMGNANTPNIIECSNNAEVSGVRNIGGIVGYGSASTIKQNNNNGYIHGNTNVGGIVGYCFGEIENCNNVGEISATGGQVGGIIGYSYLDNDGRISSCFNEGNIIGTSYSGGILGYSKTSSNLLIEKCYNNGKIEGTTYTAGIAGLLHGTNAKIINCYNTNTIEGTSVAGITMLFSDAYKVISCYNVGKLEATTKYGIVQAGSPTNCFYLNTCGATDNRGTSVSSEELKTKAPTLDKAFTIENNTVAVSETAVQNVWTTNSKINDGYPILKWQK